MKTALKSPTTVIVAAVFAAVVAILVASAYMWTSLSGVQMGLGGWLAMLLGILATLALGVGLMSLVFISARHGYDEQGDGR